jgi:hypothetical protein
VDGSSNLGGSKKHRREKALVKNIVISLFGCSVDSHPKMPTEDDFANGKTRTVCWRETVRIDKERKGK